MAEGKPIVVIPEPKLIRPLTLGDKRELVRLVYRWNGWDAYCHQANCEMLKMPLKKLADYSEAEYDIFIADFEKHKMIIFLESA